MPPVPPPAYATGYSNTKEHYSTVRKMEKERWFQAIGGTGAGG